MTLAVTIERHHLRNDAIALGAQHWPTINPRTRLDGEHTPHAITVLEHHAIPFSMLAIHDGALTCKVETTQFALQNHLRVVGTLDVLAAISNLLTTRTWPGNTEQIVHAIVFDHAATLMQTLRLTSQFQLLADTTRLLTCQVSVQLHQRDVATAREHIHTVVVIEEQRRVVISRQTAVQFPALGRVVRLEYHRLVRVIVRYEECPERTFVVTQRGGPLSATIHRALLQVIARRVFDFVKEIRHRLPMHEVLATHNGTTREHMHRCRDQIIIVTHTDDVRVGSVSPDKRILHFDFGLARHLWQGVRSRCLC